MNGESGVTATGLGNTEKFHPWNFSARAARGTLA
jgi:hypothetical protein